MTDTGGVEGGGDRKRKEPDRQKPVGVDADQEIAAAETLETMDGDNVKASEDLGKLAPKKPKKGGGDGKLRISVMDVGQGDCTLIVTPGGKRIMIDCGYAPGSQADPAAARARKKTVRDAIDSTDFLGGGKKLDILILTHPDTDHINLVPEMLADAEIVTVYHSGSIGSYQNKVQEVVSGNALKNKTSVKRVDCRWKAADDKSAVVVDIKLFGTDNVPKDGTTDVRFPVGAGSSGAGIMIWKEADCTVSILASGVASRSYQTIQDQDNVAISDGDNPNNAGSIVTLVEAFGRNGVKALFCGDATRSTEGFLLENHGDRIADVDFLMVPHHGSSITSSTLNFIKKTNPGQIVISAGREYSTPFHPRWVTVKRYLQRFAESESLVGEAKPVIMWNLPEKNNNVIALPDAQEMEKWAIEDVEPFPGVLRCLRMDLHYSVSETTTVQVFEKRTGFKDADELEPAQEEAPL